MVTAGFLKPENTDSIEWFLEGHASSRGRRIGSSPASELDTQEDW
jgi:hypothetical protein